MYIGPSLKKYAKEKQMKFSKGFVYGEIDGYMVTITEGMDIKILSISCGAFGNEKIIEFLKTVDLVKEYRVENYKITESGIQLVFKEVHYVIPVAGMSNIKKFLEITLPVLKENGVVGVEFCAECSESFTDEAETKIVIKDGFARRVHNNCVEKALKNDELSVVPKEKNNVFRGSIGALLATTFVATIMWFLISGPVNTGAVGIILASILLPPLIGLFSFKCYKGFGGGICKSGLVSLCVCQPIGYVLGYPLMVIISCAFLTIKAVVKKGVSVELQEILRKILEVCKIFFAESSFHKSEVFVVLLVCVALLSLLTSPYCFLRIYVNKNLKSMKIVKIIE